MYSYTITENLISEISENIRAGRIRLTDTGDYSWHASSASVDFNTFQRPSHTEVSNYITRAYSLGYESSHWSGTWSENVLDYLKVSKEMEAIKENERLKKEYSDKSTKGALPIDNLKFFLP